MNYLKIYIKICKRGKGSRYIENTHIEKHHIFPVSIYGNNDMIANLTTREHYICHLLLMFAFKKRYGVNSIKYAKMAMAVHKMVHRLKETDKIRFTSWNYMIARKAAKESKIGRKRPDLKGKAFFGADMETIKRGMEKMSKKRTGMKVDYPKNRKSRGNQSKETIEKIKNTKLFNKDVYKNMTDIEFEIWLSRYNLYRKDGRINGNIVQAIKSRGESIEKYYK